MIVWWVLLLCTTSLCRAADMFDWCPPPKLREKNESFRATIITEVHKIVYSGEVKDFLPGHQLARFMYYYLGAMGFDSVHLNILYDPKLVSAKGASLTLSDVYPAAQSCVVAWHYTGRVHLRFIEHGGPKENWPVDEKGKPSLMKHVYRVIRGINPVFNEIKKSGSYDWVFAVDADEFLLPVCLFSKRCKAELAVPLCDPKQPSLFNRAMQDVLRVAQYRVLDNYDQMSKHAKKRYDDCPVGSTHRVKKGSPPECATINGISLPARFWVSKTAVAVSAAAEAIGDSATVKISTVSKGLGMDELPARRSKLIVHYGFVDYVNRTTEDKWSPAQMWKTMHHVASSSYMSGYGTAHLGEGFNMLAPRKNHARGWTLEIAHLREEYNAKIVSMLIKDNAVVDLVRRYRNCTLGLTHGQ